MHPAQQARHAQRHRLARGLALCSGDAAVDPARWCRLCSAERLQCGSSLQAAAAVSSAAAGGPQSGRSFKQGRSAQCKELLRTAPPQPTPQALGQGVHLITYLPGAPLLALHINLVKHAAAEQGRSPPSSCPRPSVQASYLQSTVLNDRDFPPQAGHAARALALSPEDGMLYFSVSRRQQSKIFLCKISWCWSQLLSFKA